MIELYEFPLSVNCHKVRLMFSLLGLDYRSIRGQGAEREHKQPCFLALNPFGQVPVRVDSGFPVRDSQTILVYLARRYGGPAWWPDAAQELAAVASWLFTAVNEIARGPNAARLHRKFGQPLDYGTAIGVTEELMGIIDAHLQNRLWLALDRGSIAALPAIHIWLWRPRAASILDRFQRCGTGSRTSNTCRVMLRCLASARTQRHYSPHDSEDFTMITTIEPRPPVPPFTSETAAQKVRLAEDAWNSRDPQRVALAYTPDSEWRNRAEFPRGRAQIIEFLTRKWTRELDYRLIKELWVFTGARIAVRFAYEWRDDSGHWFRSYGNENWEFDDQGLMRRRFASINDRPIAEAERLFRWPLGRRPDEHPGLSELGL